MSFNDRSQVPRLFIICRLKKLNQMYNIAQNLFKSHGLIMLNKQSKRLERACAAQQASSRDARKLKKRHDFARSLL